MLPLYKQKLFAQNDMLEIKENYHLWENWELQTPLSDVIKHNP